MQLLMSTVPPGEDQGTDQSSPQSFSCQKTLPLGSPHLEKVVEQQLPAPHIQCIDPARVGILK